MKLKDINVLVTGGCGFIGSNFCVGNYDNFKTLIILDSLNYCGNIQNIAEIINKDNVTFINKDIVNTDFTELFHTFNIDLIINFAAQTHVDNSYYHLNRFIKDNILTVSTILEHVRNYEEKRIRIIHFSTDEIYGESAHMPDKAESIFAETSNFNPTNPYAATKASAEMIINSYKISFKMDILIVRCNNVFGRNQYFEKVIPLFINKAYHNEELTIHGHSEKIRDFIHTDDVNRAILLLIEKGNFNEIYNIGIKNPIKILDLAHYIIKKLNKGMIKIVEDRPFNDYRYNINCDKLKQLGWTPTTPFYEKLDEIILDEVASIHKKKQAQLPIVSFSTERFSDARGSIIKLPADIIIVEQYITTLQKDVLRGICIAPYAKIVTVIRGKIVNYVINFDNTPPTYVKHFLASEGLNQIYIPEHAGHLCFSLENDTILLYQLENKYNPDTEINVNYLDPTLELSALIVEVNSPLT